MLDDLAATKRTFFDYSYDGVMRSIEQSVIRLGFEQIDLLFIHDVDRWTQGKDFPRTFAAAMEGRFVRSTICESMAPSRRSALG